MDNETIWGRICLSQDKRKAHLLFVIFFFPFLLFLAFVWHFDYIIPLLFLCSELDSVYVDQNLKY